jgi:hypothetical protein
MGIGAVLTKLLTIYILDGGALLMISKEFLS